MTWLQFGVGEKAGKRLRGHLFENGGGQETLFIQCLDFQGELWPDIDILHFQRRGVFEQLYNMDAG